MKILNAVRELTDIKQKEIVSRSRRRDTIITKGG